MPIRLKRKNAPTNNPYKNLRLLFFEGNKNYYPKSIDLKLSTFAA